MKKDFGDCSEMIKTEKIRKFVKKVLAKAPKEFWTAPCSGSGKYHPPENQVEGGIIVHTRKVVQVALSLFRFFEIKNQLAKDKIIAACILHDIKKYGEPWGERTDYEHGLIAYRWLIQFAALESDPSKEDLVHVVPDIIDILELIRDHMGIWSKPEPTPALKVGQKVTEKSIWHRIVQLADYWAARNWCSFVCDEFVM